MTGDMLWAAVAVVVGVGYLFIYIFAMAIETVVDEFRSWRDRDGL